MLDPTPSQRLSMNLLLLKGLFSSHSLFCLSQITSLHLERQCVDRSFQSAYICSHVESGGDYSYAL
jgi:hypothetical protein